MAPSNSTWWPTMAVTTSNQHIPTSTTIKTLATPWPRIATTTPTPAEEALVRPTTTQPVLRRLALRQRPRQRPSTSRCLATRACCIRARPVPCPRPARRCQARAPSEMYIPCVATGKNNFLIQIYSKLFWNYRNYWIVLKLKSFQPKNCSLH